MSGTIGPCVVCGQRTIWVCPWCDAKVCFVCFDLPGQPHKIGACDPDGL